MEYIKKEELKNGDVFVAQCSNYHFLNKEGTGFSLDLNTDNTIKHEILIKGCIFSYEKIRLATPEEKHWLNECIKLNKFITFDEAIKTFIPEYVECVGIYGDATINKVYNTSDEELAKKLFSLTWNQVLIFYGHLNVIFKPSTKEAYDAQFIGKEPEFVLPEKWYIKANTKEEADIMYPYFNKSSKRMANWSSSNEVMRNRYYARFTNLQYELGVPTNEINPLIPIITFEQFKKYVLKEETVVEEVKVIEPIIKNKTEMEIWLENTKSLNLSLIGLINYIGSDETCNFTNIFDKLEGKYSEDKAKILFSKWNNQTIEPLPQFKVIESIETITKVENNEGNQFFIGDVVKSLDSNQKGEITKFRYSADKSNIIAITTFQSNSGIGIDKIEHYIESKIEKAKRLYPVGTEFYAARGNKGYYKVKNNSEFKEMPDKAICIESNGNGTVYFNNEWGEIIK